VSADFPGHARDAVESAHGGVGIFLQGCAGSVNPRHGAPGDSLGQQLAADVGAAISCSAIAVAPTMVVHRGAAELPLDETVNEATLATYRALDGPEDSVDAARARWAWRVSQQRDADTLPTKVVTQLLSVRLGTGMNMVRLIGMSHEPVSEYAALVRALYAGPPTAALGYTGACSCYIPMSSDVLDIEPRRDPARLHDQMALQYAGGGAQMWYGQPSTFTPEVESVFLTALSELEGSESIA